MLFSHQKILTYELDFARKKCEDEYDEIERDLYRLKDYFFKNRKCTCNEDSCKHFTRAICKVLGKRIEESWESMWKYNWMLYKEVLEPRVDKHREQMHDTSKEDS